MSLRLGQSCKYKKGAHGLHFDLDKDVAYFDEDVEIGLNERKALAEGFVEHEDTGVSEQVPMLEYSLEIYCIEIPELYKCLRRRQLQLQAAIHGNGHPPNYQHQAIVQMIDAHLRSVRPDLYI